MATRMLVTLIVVFLGAVLTAASADVSTVPSCDGGSSVRSIGVPNARLAWRAAPVRTASIYRGIPGAGGRRVGAISASRVEWLLVLDTSRDRRGRCWVKLRLPDRPNRAAGWVAAGRLLVRQTPWRLTISLRARALTVSRAGQPLRRLPVVIGAPPTPTPRGLFSIVHAWHSEPSAFVGSWVLGLTAHSDVLRHFEGGSGQVGIHGRGGASLLDPLGSAASHGCIRLANRSINWLVRRVGRENLAGIPVSVRQ
jgi:L,D-transpeptidase catalytic domain